MKNTENKKSIRTVSGLLTIILLLGVPLLSINGAAVFASSYTTSSYANEGTSAVSPAAEMSRNMSSTGAAVTAPVSITAVHTSKIKKQSYSGKRRKPSVKLTYSGRTLVKNKDYTLSYKNNRNPGIATVKVKGRGNYYGTGIIKFRIVINAPEKLEVENNQKKITVSWGKKSAVTGYEVYFASNRKFTKKKMTRVLKSRKRGSYSIPTPVFRRTYYVKVRAYKIIKGKTYYSKFSTVKKIRTKNQKWIDVDLSKQKIYLKKGKKRLRTYIVSTGKKDTPTIRGTFYIYKKNPKHDMIGPWDPEKNEPEYIQKDVLWATYFIRGYAFHAAYWHNNFGYPMSHGCVNMRTKEAKALYKWAPIGTRVVVHK